MRRGETFASFKRRCTTSGDTPKSAAMSSTGRPSLTSAAKAANWSAGCMFSRRSEEHTSELQSLMRISYAVFCLKKKQRNNAQTKYIHHALHQSSLKTNSSQYLLA